MLITNRMPRPDLNAAQTPPMRREAYHLLRELRAALYKTRSAPKPGR